MNSTTVESDEFQRQRSVLQSAADRSVRLGLLCQCARRNCRNFLRCKIEREQRAREQTEGGGRRERRRRYGGAYSRRSFARGWRAGNLRGNVFNGLRILYFTERAEISRNAIRLRFLAFPARFLASSFPAEIKSLLLSNAGGRVVTYCLDFRMQPKRRRDRGA